MRSFQQAFLLASLCLLALHGCQAARSTPDNVWDAKTTVARRLKAYGMTYCSRCDGSGSSYTCSYDQDRLKAIIADFGSADTIELCCKKALPRSFFGDAGGGSLSLNTIYWASQTRGCSTGVLRTRYTLGPDKVSLVPAVSGTYTCAGDSYPVYGCTYN